jgi:DNA-binding PadR family transcriptional regulator
MASTMLAEKLRKRVIQNFMDILILTEMKKGALSGYDVIGLIHNRFGVLMSSGTIYSLLYSLERNGLIKGVWNQRKRVYELTEEGEQNIKVITKANQEVQDFLKRLSLLNTTWQSPRAL